MYKLLSLAVLLFCSTANATDVTLRVDTGYLLPLSSPQSDLFAGGFNGNLKLAINLNRYVDVGPTVGFFWASPNNFHDGLAEVFGAGLRVKRPHDLTSYAGISPWLDADLLYVRTGKLNMLGWDVGGGFSIPLDDKQRYWLGPYVRFTQSVRTSDPAYDHHDVNLFAIGIEFEFGTAGVKPAEEIPVRVVYQEKIITKEVHNEIFECPIPASLPVVHKKLILLNKLYFATNKDIILAKSQPALDEVLAAVNNPEYTFNVLEVEGHTDSTGSKAHNLDLSKRRAQSVATWLVAHGFKGIAIAAGYGSEKPIATNKTKQGRAENRRVEFFVSE
jgi:outer membrane protein OmpA-like peptidoglycan-associated protein